MAFSLPHHTSTATVDIETHGSILRWSNSMPI
jgi:hypothetical protein